MDQKQLVDSVIEGFAKTLEKPLVGDYLNLEMAQKIVDDTITRLDSVDEEQIRYLSIHRNRLAASLSIIPRASHRNAVALDVGCYGPMAYWLLEYLGYARVDGVEMRADLPDVAAIREVTIGDRRYESKVYNFDLASSDWPIQGSYDTVLFFETLEHINNDPVGVMMNINKLLVDGGTLALSVPNSVSYRTLREFMAGMPPWVYWFFNPDLEHEPRHCFEYTPFVLKSLITASGFEERCLRTLFAFSEYEHAKEFIEIGELLSIEERYFGDVILTQARKISSRPAVRYPDCIYNGDGYYRGTFPMLEQQVWRGVGNVRALYSQSEELKAELEATSSQLEATSSQLEATSSQLEATSSQLEATSSELEVIQDHADRLAGQLFVVYRHPFKPIKTTLTRLAIRVALMAKPALSRDLKTRLKRSLSKREPSRILKNWTDIKTSIGVLRRQANGSGEGSSHAALYDGSVGMKFFLGNEPIIFDAVEHPVVSIVIPSYRDQALLRNCLRAIAACRKSGPEFEVIAIDDCPEHPTLDFVPDSAGFVKLRNESNLGFLRSCNKAASHARGRIICFLNSDTIVTEGWLSALVESLDVDPDVGIVGGLLLNSDCTVQDAGWRILANGWGHKIGAGANVENGAYNYRRQVDCVTGACLAISTELWGKLSGFDDNYAPAFYEEFDLCFRARELGKKTIFEPGCRVFHLGSASYGAETRDTLTQRNHNRFVVRHANILRKQPVEVTERWSDHIAGPRKRCLLMVDDFAPDPTTHAGAFTTYSYIKLLVSLGWRVIFFAARGERSGGGSEKELGRLGVGFIRAPDDLKSWLLANGQDVEQVWIARPDLTDEFLGDVRAHSSASIKYYTHDLHYLRLEREAEHTGNAAIRKAARKMRELEVGVFDSVDVVMTPSADEANIIGGVTHRNVRVIPPYFFDDGDIRVRLEETFSRTKDILFLGGFPHTPNVDAALFLVNEIMPIVWREEPEARVLLVGYAPPEEIRELAGDRVVVTGQVSDLQPWLGRARLMLAPLRYGAGVKGKVVDALRFGLPVVTTSIGAEGIGIANEVDGVVAEKAEDLAKAAIMLLSDPRRCASLSQAGAELVRKRFSHKIAEDVMTQLFPLRCCGVCGSSELTSASAEGNYREAVRCVHCYSLSRMDALGTVLSDRVGGGTTSCAADILSARPGFRLHELGFVGAISEVLRGTTGYSMSEYFPGVPLGEIGPNGVRCEDVTRLTFAESSFDAVVSQDVMEHVDAAPRGFGEISRVLKSGGSHFFTIPYSPALNESRVRARIVDGKIENLLDPEYHGDPVRDEGALVFTDFGRDLPSLVEQDGTVLLEHHVHVAEAHPLPMRVFEQLKVPSLPELTEPQLSKLFDLQEREQVFESIIRALYMSEVVEGDTVIDGGAHTGMHTVPLAALVGENGRVHAFEPIPFCGDHLTTVLGDKPQLTLHRKALGKTKQDRVTFHQHRSDAALSTLLTRYTDTAGAADEISVQMISVDSLELDQLRFIKLDLEGYDFFCLQGARETLNRARPVFVFEFLGQTTADECGVSEEEFFDFFDGLRYKLLDLVGCPYGSASFRLSWSARLVPHYVVGVPVGREGEIAAILRAAAWSWLLRRGEALT